MGFTDLDRNKVTQGAGNVYVDGPAGAFGDLRIISIEPLAQGDFVYGIPTQVFTTSSFAGATITAVSGVCELSSGTNTNGSATVQLRRGMKYRPGQGSMMRATALYDTPDAGNAQFVGAGTAECGYFIGYFGTSFGILHSQTGQREIRRYDITTGAGTGDITVTLDGYSIVVPITGGSDVYQTAHQLSLADYSQLGDGGWLADAISGSVFYVAARSNATSTGSYSISGASIAGTFTRLKAGEAQTNTFIPSASFSIDKLDGTGPTGMVLDTSRGNVFEIAFQYLGFGNALFSIEDPETGKPAVFHTIKNANARTTPVLKNPNVSVLATSANIGGTTSTTLKTVSMGAFIEGNIATLDPKFAKSFDFSGVNSATYVPLALLKSTRVFNGESAFGEFDIVRLAAANQVNNQSFTIGFFIDADISGPVDYQYVSETQSIVAAATLTPTGAGANTIVNLADIQPFHEIIVASDSATAEDLKKLKFIFTVGRPLLIAIKTTASVTGQVSINWFEQQ